MEQLVGTSSGRGSSRARSGFTLIEIILVVLIIGLTTAFAIPSFVRSYQGAKLRTSARSVVMAHRYARSVAVLQQKRVQIYFYLDQGKIEVVSLAPDEPASQPSPFPDEEAESLAVREELRKSLEDGVRILEFELEKEGQENQDSSWVNYHPNGMSDEYAIRLIDGQDKTLMIRIDPLSGKAKVGDLDGGGR
jgi:prepilin-type N-terminal cleavage/methylation domain-containing protein